MNDLAYYRDIINCILQENDDNDIPRPPSRRELALSKFYRSMTGRTINRMLWKDARFGREDNDIVMFLMFNNREHNQIDASAHWENNQLVFYTNIILYAGAQLDRMSPAELKQLKSEKLYQLHKDLLNSFGVNEKLEFIDWSGVWLDAAINVDCPKFSEYLTEELAPLSYLLKDFSIEEVEDIIDNFLTNGTKA